MTPFISIKATTNESDKVTEPARRIEERKRRVLKTVSVDFDSKAEKIAKLDKLNWNEGE
jgi:hypothetical protein